MYGFSASQYLWWRPKMFSPFIRVTLGSAHKMILVELRGRLWLIDNRIVGGADWLCAGLDRQLGGYLGLGWAHRVIGGLPHFRLRGVDSPSHWLQSLGAKWQSVDHLQQYFRPGHYFVTVHFWNSDIQYTTIFSTNIPYSPQPGPSLVPSAKSIFVQAFFTLILWSNTDLFSSFNWLHSHIFLCCIERRLFINSKKGKLGNRKMHLSNKQRSITTAFLPTIRSVLWNNNQFI